MGETLKTVKAMISAHTTFSNTAKGEVMIGNVKNTVIDTGAPRPDGIDNFFLNRCAFTI